jgi:hypothetical protein
LRFDGNTKKDNLCPIFEAVSKVSFAIFAIKEMKDFHRGKPEDHRIHRISFI